MGEFTNIGVVSYLSGGILFLYMAFNSGNNLQTILMNQAGLGDVGFYLLGFLFLMMGVGSLLSTAAINKYGTRMCLVFGGIGNTIYLLAQMMVGGKY